MSTRTIVNAVSFAKTPAHEITELHNRIVALGWKEVDRGDPWVISYERLIPDAIEDEVLAEVQTLMRDYWLDADDIKALLDR
jgi:hypothetical protein